MSIDELQAAIAQLPKEELARLSNWLEEFMADEWDRQIEDDLLAGQLDSVIRQADEDFEAGRCTPLP